ncbi:hypothetical protein AKJ16_DCAP25327 [Drosera capensis]
MMINKTDIRTRSQYDNLSVNGDLSDAIVAVHSKTCATTQAQLIVTIDQRSAANSRRLASESYLHLSIGYPYFISDSYEQEQRFC